MKEAMSKEFFSAIKWTWVIIFVGFVFYLVYPKYSIIDQGKLRINSITGTVESWSGEIIKYGKR